jgi:hypothetical protein
MTCIQNGIYGDASPQIKQIYSSTITISKTVYDTDAGGNGEVNSVNRLQSASPYSSLSRSPYSSLGRSQQSPFSTLQHYEVSPCSTIDRRQTGLATSPSLVSGNLSELDNLLDDLSESTKQYTLNRDKRARGEVALSTDVFLIR